MTDNAITATGGYNNPHYRAQELYPKGERSTEIVEVILKYEGKTAAPAWPASSKLLSRVPFKQIIGCPHCDSRLIRCSL